MFVKPWTMKAHVEFLSGVRIKKCDFSLPPWPGMAWNCLPQNSMDLNGFWLSNTRNIPCRPGFSGLLFALPKNPTRHQGESPVGTKKWWGPIYSTGGSICSSGELLTPMKNHKISRWKVMKWPLWYPILQHGWSSRSPCIPSSYSWIHGLICLLHIPWCFIYPPHHARATSRVPRVLPASQTPQAPTTGVMNVQELPEVLNGLRRPLKGHVDDERLGWSLMECVYYGYIWRCVCMYVYIYMFIHYYTANVYRKKCI